MGLFQKLCFERDHRPGRGTLPAHNLPDMAGAIAMPLCMLVMLFVYDY